jgi:predicted TIM-barrel fold metal-dependent hydrolase
MRGHDLLCMKVEVTIRSLVSLGRKMDEMIIDSHIHIFGGRDWWPEWAWYDLNKLQASRFGKTTEEMSSYREESFDPTGEMSIESMDRAGVDKAVACVADLGLTVPGQDSKLSIEKINLLTHELVKGYPDRLYFSVGVDPRRKNALEILEMGVKELEAKCLKLYPGAGWYPNDRVAYPLYEKCLDLNIPINVHTGPVFGPMKSKFTHPIHLDEVAADFPELTIYCTHCGHVSFMEMVAIARTRPNIVCDMAAWMGWFHCGERLHYYQVWRFITNMMGSARLLFASDQTCLKFLPGEPNEYVDLVRALTQIPEEAKAVGVTFTEEEKENFFSRNAIRLLSLE